MNSDKILLSIAMIAVLISAVGVGFTYYTVTGFQAWLTGYATDTATANVTIQTSAAINFTTDNIDWGTSTFPAGPDNVTLSTHDGANGTNWNTVTQGFVLENIGNINITIDLETNNNASTFIGGTAGGGPKYQYNVTNNEAGSCINSTGFDLGQYYNVNDTAGGTRVCDVFQFVDGSDTIKIDLMVVIPSDAVGTKGSIMTATTG